MDTITHVPPSGAELIAQERQRGIDDEGWDNEHDDDHTDESLARAAAHYASPGPAKMMKSGRLVNMWPSSWASWWDKKKNKSRTRQLVIAGALIAAEIDRLQRAEESDRCMKGLHHDA